MRALSCISCILTITLQQVLCNGERKKISFRPSMRVSEAIAMLQVRAVVCSACVCARACAQCDTRAGQVQVCQLRRLRVVHGRRRHVTAGARREECMLTSRSALMHAQSLQNDMILYRYKLAFNDELEFRPKTIGGPPTTQNALKRKWGLVSGAVCVCVRSVARPTRLHRRRWDRHCACHTRRRRRCACRCGVCDPVIAGVCCGWACDRVLVRPKSYTRKFSARAS
jgi:hypothetical protein